MSDALLQAKLNLETGTVRWKELQRFFAGGVVLCVATELDMVDVALQISKDNRFAVEAWISQTQLTHVNDEQALRWFENDVILWSVVVKPWILVQEFSQQNPSTH